MIKKKKRSDSIGNSFRISFVINDTHRKYLFIRKGHTTQRKSILISMLSSVSNQLSSPTSRVINCLWSWFEGSLRNILTIGGFTFTRLDFRIFKAYDFLKECEEKGRKSITSSWVFCYLFVIENVDWTYVFVRPFLNSCRCYLFNYF